MKSASKVLLAVFVIFSATAYAASSGDEKLTKIDDKSKSVVNKVAFSSAEDELVVIEKPKINPYKKQKKMRVSASDKLEQDDFKRLEEELELIK